MTDNAFSPAAMMLTYETKENMELVGFFDMLLAQTPRSTYLNFLEGFLRKTVRYALYRYVIALIIVSPHSELSTLVLRVARQEQNAQKVEILLSAFDLIQHDPIITSLIEELEQKQKTGSKGRQL